MIDNKDNSNINLLFCALCQGRLCKKSYNKHISLRLIFFIKPLKVKHSIIVTCKLAWTINIVVCAIYVLLSRNYYQSSFVCVIKNYVLIIQVSKPYLPFSNLCSLLSLTGSCISSLSPIRNRLRRWGRRLNRLRTRRVKPQLAGYATKPSLPMAVATSVHIAKRNSVLGAEDECLCGQIR